jgi:hypothetical protein
VHCSADLYTCATSFQASLEGIVSGSGPAPTLPGGMLALPAGLRRFLLQQPAGAKGLVPLA